MTSLLVKSEVDASQHDVGDSKNSEDKDIVKKLASLSPFEYDRVRKDQAKLLGVQLKTLDMLVNEARICDETKSRAPFDDVDPHSDPIDPAQLLGQISNLIRTHIVLDQKQADAVALWIAFTWFIDSVEISPILIINAPEKACGKSQLLDLVSRMVLRPLPAANITTAAMFRAVELWGPTLLIDEADTFIHEVDGMSGLINAGYTRKNAFVVRVVGENYEPRQFGVWGAKALAGISLEKHLPDSTMSRALVINLRRKLPHEKVSLLRHADDSVFYEIASKLARFSADYSKRVRLSRPDLPDSLGDRDQDNWEPLFKIAEYAGEKWLIRARASALQISATQEKTSSTGNELLSDIRDVLSRLAVDRLSTSKLIDALCKDDEAPWATYNRGNQITPRQLSKLLKAYGIMSKTFRIDGYETAKGFTSDQFKDVFARYLDFKEQ